MLKLLIDTCVWIDLATNVRQKSFLEAFGYIVGGSFVQLIVPRVVLDEFNRNKSRIIETNGRSAIAALRQAREVVLSLGDSRRMKATLRHLDDVEFKVAKSKENVSDSIEIVDRLFKIAHIVETTDQIMLRASNRGIKQTAPFHRQRNGLNDAILIEIYADLIANKGRDRFVFVTHNTKDFSQGIGDQRLPHDDISNLFDGRRSIYSISLFETMRARFRSELRMLSDASDWPLDTRAISEIVRMEEELAARIRHERHLISKDAIKMGRTKLVKETDGNQPGVIREDIWKGALQAAKVVKKRYSSAKFGPYDSFDWGMINGKLSAIRWVLGDQWDALDT